MDLHSAKTAANSSSEIRSVFICPEKPGFVWDLNDTIIPWIFVPIASIASLATILLNALVIIAIKRKKELQRISYILLSSLAVTDLLVGAINMPLSATVDVLIALQKVRGVCMIDSVNVHFMFLIFASSLQHLSLIAWERYVAIQKWMDYRSIVTRSRVKKLAIGAWFAALLTTLPGLLMVAIGADPEFVWVQNIIIALGSAASILIVYFYIMVYLGVRKRKLNQISQVSSLVAAKLENKVAKTSFLITAALFISFLPAAVVGTLGNFFPAFRKNWAFRSAETLMQLTSIMNPCIYWYRDRRFRNALLELLRLRKSQATPPADGTERVVRRKKQLGFHVREQNVENHMARFARTASYHQASFLDDAPRNSLPRMLKCRSMSSPSVAIGNSFCHGSQQKQPTCPNVTTSATIHDARLREFGKSDAVELQRGEQRSGEKILKRSTSTPSLAKANSSCCDSRLRQSLSITISTIRTGCSQFEANPNLRKEIKRGQGTTDRALFRDVTMKTDHCASPNSSTRCQKEQKPSIIRRAKSVPFYSTNRVDIFEVSKDSGFGE